MRKRHFTLERLERREMFAGMGVGVTPDLGDIVSDPDVPAPSGQDTWVLEKGDVDTNPWGPLVEWYAKSQPSLPEAPSENTIECISTSADVDVQFDVATGVVQITGGDNSDSVTVSRLGDTIRVEVGGNPLGHAATPGLNDVVHIFDIDIVNSLEFYGNGCGDTFINTTDIPSLVFGGDGDDALTSGDGDDIVYGGAGNDTINGDRGKDQIYGEDGEDTINGGDGKDQLYGGDDDDTISGGGAKDVLDGGSGVDRLEGDKGHDLLYGGSEADILRGGDGDDRLFGGIGDNDTLTGGPGADRFLMPATFEEFPLIGNVLLAAEDTTTAVKDEDAIIYFDDSVVDQIVTLNNVDVEFSPRGWTDDEILAVDTALAALQDHVGGTALMKTPGGDPLIMERVGNGVIQPPNFGTSSVALWNDLSNTVTFSDNAFYDGNIDGIDATLVIEVPLNEIQADVLWHIGRLWWDESNTFWTGFTAVSSWVENVIPLFGSFELTLDGEWYYDGNSGFVESGSKSSPYDDAATTFAFAVMASAGLEYPHLSSEGEQWLEQGDMATAALDAGTDLSTLFSDGEFIDLAEKMYIMDAFFEAYGS